MIPEIKFEFPEVPQINFLIDLQGQSLYHKWLELGLGVGDYAAFLEWLKVKGDKGASAYDVAVELGFVGTQAEWVASLKGEKGDKGDKGEAFKYEDFTPEQIEGLKQPAIDAAEEVEALIEVIEGNELSRISAENGRVQAETGRAIAENNRETNELARAQSEITRGQNETTRQQAEITREANEGMRITAESERKSAEELRVIAEQNRAAELSAKANHGYTTNPKTLKEVDDSLVQLAGDVSELEIKDAVQGAMIKGIENILSIANLGQSTQVSVSGVSPLLLPKTAANTGMQVQLFGQSAQNLVVNGDFRNGRTGWIVGSSTNSVTNGILTNTGNGTSISPHTYSNIGANVTGNKYYARAKVKTKSALCTRIEFTISNNIQSISNPSIDNLYTMSGVVTAPSNYALIVIFHHYATAANANGASIEVDNVMAINLTATFGAGNEPTKEQCDLLFANYFEGSDNVLGTGRIRSVNSSGLLPSYLYLNGGQLRSNRLVKDEIRKGTNGYELVKRVGVGTLGSEIVVNAGASGQTDWVDTNGDGLADNWLKVSAIGTPSIVTGNGFTGNAQRFQCDGTTNYQGLNYSLVEIGSAAIGKLYKLSFKYRASIDFMGNARTSEGFNFKAPANTGNAIYFETYWKPVSAFDAAALRFLVGIHLDNWLEIDEVSLKEVSQVDGAALGTLLGASATTIGSNIHYTLATPVITPISHAGLLNSNSNGTAYFEPIIADAGVYGSNLSVQLTDYPIASFESIRKYANGTYTELNIATAIITSEGLSFTHPDLVSGDLVMFTYAYSKESIGRSMTLTHYDNRYVKVDTANGKTYRIDFVVTNGVVVPTATEV